VLDLQLFQCNGFTLLIGHGKQEAIKIQYRANEQGRHDLRTMDHVLTTMVGAMDEDEATGNTQALPIC